MDPDFPTHAVVDPIGTPRRVVFPTPAQLRELEAALAEAVLALDADRRWEPVDGDVELESDEYVVADH